MYVRSVDLFSCSFELLIVSAFQAKENSHYISNKETNLAKGSERRPSEPLVSGWGPDPSWFCVPFPLTLLGAGLSALNFHPILLLASHNKQKPNNCLVLKTTLE